MLTAALDPRRRADRAARARIRAGPRRADRRDRGGQVDPARRARPRARHARRQRPGPRRAGAGERSASSFELAADHPARWRCSTRTASTASRASRWSSAASSRRTAAAAPSSTTSRSRPALLRELGALLVEIHGQHDDRGLLNRAATAPCSTPSAGSTRRGRGGLERGARARGGARARRARSADARSATATGSNMRASEIDALAPEAGEEARLAGTRAAMQAGARLGDDADRRSTSCSAGRRAALAQLRQAARRLDADRRRASAARRGAGGARPGGDRGGRSRGRLAARGRGAGLRSGRLEEAEARLFEIRALARKHRVEPDALPRSASECAASSRAIEAGGERIAALERELVAARAAYDAAAAALSSRARGRGRAARRGGGAASWRR